jgi:predicted nucleic acid-binding protein
VTGTVICVDASIGAKWLLGETDSNRAVKLRRDARLASDPLIAPPHFIPEVSSAVYKRFTLGEVTAAEAERLLQNLARFPIDVTSPPDLAARAFEIASAFRFKWIFDAFYVALADIVGCDLWTADARLHRDVHSRYPNVRLLAEYPLT